MFLIAALLFANPIAVKAARMFDARKGVVVQPALVVVEGDRIAQVGGRPPSGAQVIDLGDATLLPGLMDAHTHLTFESGPNWYRDSMDLLLRWPAEQAQYAAEYARRTLLAGFTTVRNVGAGDYRRRRPAQRHRRTASVEGPRMLVAVNAIGSRGGHADLDPILRAWCPPRPDHGVCNGADECRAAVR